MVAAIPVLVVGAWYVKDAVMFGTASTSSWLGMNLARDVLYKAPRTQIITLEKNGTLTPLAGLPPFQNPDTYVPRFVTPGHTGTPALDQLYKADGSANFNNPLYASLSSQYLRDDLAFIAAHPGEYETDVNISVRNWFTATDQNFTPVANWHLIKGYTQIYDQSVEWQPRIAPAVAFVAFFAHKPPALGTLSYQAVILYGLTLIGLPVIVWRRRKDDPAVAGTLAFLWFTVGYAFVVSSLIEVGENERFRFELGTLPVVGGIVVLAAVCRALSARARSRHRPGRRAAGPDPVTPIGLSDRSTPVACRPRRSAGTGNADRPHRRHRRQHLGPERPGLRPSPPGGRSSSPSSSSWSVPGSIAGSMRTPSSTSGSSTTWSAVTASSTTSVSGWRSTLIRCGSSR